MFFLGSGDRECGHSTWAIQRTYYHARNVEMVCNMNWGASQFNSIYDSVNSLYKELSLASEFVVNIPSRSKLDDDGDHAVPTRPTAVAQP